VILFAGGEAAPHAGPRPESARQTGYRVFETAPARRGLDLDARRDEDIAPYRFFDSAAVGLLSGGPVPREGFETRPSPAGRRLSRFADR
jgi:hypothetical protein